MIIEDRVITIIKLPFIIITFPFRYFYVRVIKREKWIDVG